MPIIPFRVVGRVKPDDNAPSARRHYSAFVPNTGVPAPVLRIGTLLLAATGRLESSLHIGATGSCVPCQGLIRGHAAFMPDAGWAVDRLPPTLARGTEVQIPVSTSMIRYDTLGEDESGLDELSALLRPYPATLMRAYPVGVRVGNVRNNDTALLEPVALAS